MKPTGGPLARTRWQALGTSVELLVADGAALPRARAILEDQLDEVDRACSRFREDSELTRANAAAGRSVRVDPLLAEAIDVALRAARLTCGDVDPTIGGALVLAGYDRDWSLLQRDPEAPEPTAARVRASVCPGWQAVELDRQRRTLRVPRGVTLDLGATAKAWAADRAALAIHEQTRCGVLVNLGGDIATAGAAPGDGRDGDRDGGWAVHVTDDHRDGVGAPGQTIAIAGGGLATSSTTTRRWRRREQTMHHIIDPATWLPAAEVWRTVSVAAGDCADANTAATAAIVRGARAPEWLAGLGLPARLIARDGRVVTVAGWPPEGERR